jgi:lysophospholipase L1-like esterase
LGDSYTIGEGVAPGEAWPAQLARRLRARGCAVEDPVVLARTGWTTDELAGALAQASLAGPFDVATLLVGVNDQYRGRAPATFRTGFEDLLASAIALAGNRTSRVLVVSIPDWGVTTFAREGGHDAAAVAAAIDGFNAIARELARARGVAFVDVTGLSREAGAAPGMLVGDGLHPSAAQYALWTEQLVEPAEALLGCTAPC